MCTHAHTHAHICVTIYIHTYIYVRDIYIEKIPQKIELLRIIESRIRIDVRHVNEILPSGN